MKNRSRMRCDSVAVLTVLMVFAGWPRLTPAASAPAERTAPHAPAQETSLTAIVLVAQDVVSDPNFGGSIVVVMNNLAPAPVGIILNRPTALPVSRLFPKLKQLARVRDKVYFGGPVELTSVWYLFRAGKAPARAIRVCAGVYVSSSRKLLLQLLSRPRPMQGLRIFVGHAGWAPGQLQMEIQGGAWVPRRADAVSIFEAAPLLPWPSGPGPKGPT